VSDPPTKAYVFPIQGREADISTLKTLIAAGGCVVICPNDPVDAFSHCVEEADAVVILICRETIGDELTGPVVELANRLGKRIVGVWAMDAELNKLPPSLHRYGDANVRLNADEIASAVCQGESIWVTPEGVPRPRPKTPRHKGH
jgi:hypothetical protein